jgi:hypothetical protein
MSSDYIVNDVTKYYGLKLSWIFYFILFWDEGKEGGV